LGLPLTSDNIYNEGFPTTQKAKVADVSKFGKAVSGFYIKNNRMLSMLLLSL